MLTVREQANEFLIRHDVKKFPVDVDRIARELKYSISYYSNSLEIIEDLHASSYMTQEGFSTYTDGKGYIFLHDDLRHNRARRRVIIAHELGHIEMHYSGDSKRVVVGDVTEIQVQLRREEEADDFARYLLAPAQILYDMHVIFPGDIAQYCDIDTDTAALAAQDVYEYREQLDNSTRNNNRDANLKRSFRTTYRQQERREHPLRIWAGISWAITTVAFLGLVTLIVTDYLGIGLLDRWLDPSPAAQVSSLSDSSSLSSELSVPESSNDVPEVVPSEAEEPEASQAETPAAPPVSTAPKEPTRSGNETKTQDRVIYYQAPVQQTPTQQVPAAQETPQETEPAYTPPPESSKSEPVYSQPPKEIKDDGNTYYWTAGGSVYHSSPDCYHIRDKAQASGILQDALDAGKKRLCYDCPKNN